MLKKKAFCRFYVLAIFVVNLVMVGLLELYWLIQIFLKTFAFYLSRIALISLIKNLTLFKAFLDSSTILHHQNGFHILPKVLLNGFSLFFAKLSCRMFSILESRAFFCQFCVVTILMKYPKN